MSVRSARTRDIGPFDDNSWGENRNNRSASGEADEGKGGGGELLTRATVLSHNDDAYNNNCTEHGGITHTHTHTENNSEQTTDPARIAGKQGGVAAFKFG